MSDTPNQYQPGDIANGHVLDQNGTWQPLPTQPATPTPPKKGKGKKLVGGIVAAVVAIAVLSNLGGGSSDDTKADPTPAASETKSEPEADEPKTEDEAAEAAEVVEAEPEPELTVSQENAIESAQSYLDMSGFSEKGLIKQLSSQYGDGFPRKDAIFAVKYLKVDWNAEAVESAKSYLDMSGFSRQGLIDQLSSPYGEQFTVEQATYAANKVGL